jgi:PAS domain S-box-containing protein
MTSSATRFTDRTAARGWLVAALGTTLTAAAVTHFAIHDTNDLMVVAATVLPAVALLAYGLWFCVFGPQVARGDAVFVWAVGGAGVVLTLDLWAVAVDAYGAGAAINHVLIQHTSIGALGAAVAGTYSDRDRQQSRAHGRLRRALDTAMDGIAVLDDERQVAYANQAFCDDYGACNPDDVVGVHWTEFYPAEATDRLADVFDTFDADARDHWHGKVFARRDVGHTYPQELSVTPLDNGGYVCVARDVTSREERDQRLRVLNRVLRHNVRNALNVVLGRASRLENHLDTDTEAAGTPPESVETDREPGEHPGADLGSIKNAAEDLLAVSEKARVVERVLGEDDAASAPLADMVASEADRVRSNHPDATIEVTTDVDAAVDARFRLAVRELLVNAVEHNDAGAPHVTVTAGDVNEQAVSVGTTDRDGGEAVGDADNPVGSDDRPFVRVSDNGSGIPSQEHRALEGVDEAPLQHGSGIGLWAVYWLSQQCGATIETDDDSTITIYLSTAD